MEISVTKSKVVSYICMLASVKLCLNIVAFGVVLQDYIYKEPVFARINIQSVIHCTH